MNETMQPKTKGLFTRISHKIQKTLRISKTNHKYKKDFDLDDLITEQISVDNEHTMNNLANSIKILDTVIVEEPPPLNKIGRSIKMSNLLLEDLSNDSGDNDSGDNDSGDNDSGDNNTGDKDTISTHNECLHDLCLQDLCLQDEDDTCDHEICFREVTIMNISGANGKKPTYKITNTCRCPRLRLC